MWSGYARTVYGSYSPLNSALAEAVSKSTTTLAFLRRRPPHAHDPNMLLAAIQYLVLRGTEHPIAALYAPDANPVAGTSLTELVESFCSEYDAELTHILATRRIQTNEVGRSGGLALGLACAAKLVGEPVGLVDAGTSAGLNLLMDRYLLRFGAGSQIGPESSPVQVDCRVEPSDLPLPSRLPSIAVRVGLDRAPVDLADPSNVSWLLACIWPGTGRQERAAAAIRLASEHPPPLVKGDMVADLGRVIESVRPGPVVVMTSWSFSYLQEDERRGFERELAAAAEGGPVVWVCCDSPGASDLFQPSEPPPDEGDIPSVFGLAVFDRDEVRSHCLGYMHAHGAWVRWLDPVLTPGTS
ncbi:MAG TPA: DUF2332 domain-containing protein [Acidimicrobiales bacterium]|nr:DUF2332 domain-containing protein [Acidimicrobiales bacterium]